MQQLAAAVTGLSTLSDALRSLDQLRTSDSLISYTRSARVEPITLLDSDCMYLDITPEVMQSLLSTFAGYYLQAWAMSAVIGNISVMQQLEKLNPNRDAMSTAIGRVAVGVESMAVSMESLNYTKYRLPRPGDARNANLAMEEISMEAEFENKQKQNAADRKEKDDFANRYETFRPKVGSKSDDIKEIHELVNLSVGKLLKVTLKGDNNNSIDIPVAVRLLVNSIATEPLIHILSIGSKDNSLKERYHSWRSGEISFWKDLILCSDLIDEHRRTLIKDTSGLYSQILARSKGNTLSGLISGNMSVATASNIAVISSDTAAMLEARIAGRLSNFQVRQKIFEKTYLMLMAVIDKERDRVTFYHRGIPTSTSLNNRELKASNKSGPDISDILNAYRAGTSPSL